MVVVKGWDRVSVLVAWTALQVVSVDQLQKVLELALVGWADVDGELDVLA